MLSSKTSAGRSPATQVARRKRGSAPDLDLVGWFITGVFRLLGTSACDVVLVGLVRLKVARYRCGLPISVKEEMAGAVGVTRSELRKSKNLKAGLPLVTGRRVGRQM